MKNKLKLITEYVDSLETNQLKGEQQAILLTSEEQQYGTGTNDSYRCDGMHNSGGCANTHCDNSSNEIRCSNHQCDHPVNQISCSNSMCTGAVGPTGGFSALNAFPGL